jgi:hypothetical protein
MQQNKLNLLTLPAKKPLKAITQLSSNADKIDKKGFPDDKRPA